MRPAWLIAEREFRAYVTTVSFWIALATGPVIMAGVTAFAGVSTAAHTATIGVSAPAAAFAPATAAIEQAARLDGRSVHLVAGDGGTRTALVVEEAGDGVVRAHWRGPQMLSPAASALAVASLERDAALARLGAGQPAPQAAPPAPRDLGAISRFGLVMMLWLTLTGSVGMLLQAVVRERANHALEALMASARAWEIVVGKLVGVGAVSVLVLAAWLGSVVALKPLASAGGGAVMSVLSGMADPAALARAAIVYGLAFAFYGFVTIGLGARARDSAEAQNLSRPMFAVLLLGFFCALAGAGGAGLGWLAFLPPLSPFLLLQQAPGRISALAELMSIGGLAVAAGLAGVWAVGRLSLSSERRSVNWPWMAIITKT